MGTRAILSGVGLILVIVVAFWLLLADSPAQGPPDVEGTQQVERGPATRLGLDFAVPRTSAVSGSDIEATMEALRRRLVGLGLKDGVVGQSDVPGEVIYVVLPLSTDDHVKKLLIANAELEVRLQAKGTDTYKTKKEAEKSAATQPGGSSHYKVCFYPLRQNNDDAVREGWVILENDVVLSSGDINNARAVRSSGYSGGDSEIEFSLTPEAAERFGEVTGDHIGRGLAMVL